MKTYNLSEKLCFHADYRGTHYLGQGWSRPEKNHCWSDGYKADITLYIRELSESDLILRVNCAAFLAGNEFETQNIDVYANQKLICSWKVSKKSCFEVVINRCLIKESYLKIEFDIKNPISPAQCGLSLDQRLLGIDIYDLVLIEKFSDVLPTAQLIGQGHDLVGDMYKSLKGFHRAIRIDSNKTFEHMLNSGIYEKISSRGLMPEHMYRKATSTRYSYYVSALTGVFIYPSNYPLLMLRDAAKTWIAINRHLLSLSDDLPYGLSDGHYGNFVQFDNATARWCDLGSIVNNPSSLSFGLAEFINCYVTPLFMFSLPESGEINIRQFMSENRNGISQEAVSSFIGHNPNLNNIYNVIFQENREIALIDLEKIIDAIDFSHHKGFWSDYRNVEALTSAWQGDLLQNTEDSRYKAVLDLVKRSDATTFIDIGCNDGIFSLMCVREGLKGIAIDLDEHAINKLYSFVQQHPEIELSIAYGGFMDVVHTADLVLALALTHHLVLSQQLNFSAIAKQLALVAERSVITEFMPDGLGGTPQHPAPFPNPLPTEYTLENFVGELSKYFRVVEVISYDRLKNKPWYSNRILIYCEKS